MEYVLHFITICVTDIDECSSQSHGCDQICNNKNGSYNCLCNVGFFLGDDRRICYKGIYY